VGRATFEEGVSRILASFQLAGDAAAIDPLADPAGACAALDALLASPEGERAGDASLVLRVGPELGPSSAGKGFAEDPAEPWWIRLRKGARTIDALPQGEERSRPREVARVVVEEETTDCCDAPGCTAKRSRTRAWLLLDPKDEAAEGSPANAPSRVLVAEEQPLAGAPARLAHAVASRVARALGVPLDGGAGDDAADSPPAAPPLRAAALARIGLRSEGERIVLRDFASAGPRDFASRSTLFGLAFFAIAAVLALGAARAIYVRSGGLAIGVGSAAALFAVFGYAFLGVARFSARYRAGSAPLVSLGRDRVIVLPWVSRSGSVDLRPEGRLGAAIPVGEVRGLSVQHRKQGFAVELDTDHGAIDAVTCRREDEALFWCGALRRAVEEVRHPGAHTSARQRARARAQSTGV
jgi:hypothetical protein